MLSLESVLPISFTKSSTRMLNLKGLSHSYFSKATAGQFRSTRAMCEGSIALKMRASLLASKVASSTRVLIAEATAFHSTALEVFVNSKGIRTRVQGLPVISFWVYFTEKRGNGDGFGLRRMGRRLRAADDHNA